MGSNATVVRRSSPPSPCTPAPFVSEVRGVGSNGEDEEPAALVRSTDLGRAYNAPLRIEPETGKVGEDVGKPKSKVVCDVLKDRVAGSKNAKGVRDVRPDVPLISGSFPPSGETEGLTGIPAGQNVDRADVPPVHRGDVTQVGNRRVVVGEDA